MTKNNSARKICIVTGTRAEYGLLYWLMKYIAEDEELELQIIATCMHLSPEFGLTYKEIEKNGFKIDRKIEILLSSDTPVGISKSMALCQASMAEAFADLQPDIVVVLGDRFEILATAAAALVCRIPLAHIAGGETTEGAIDEAFRHSITKMAQLHFTSTGVYTKRVIQLGEQPENVYYVGAVGIDNIKQLPLLSKEEFEKSIEFILGKQNFLVTFHPVTLENATSGQQFEKLLSALDEFPDAKIIITKPNADTDSRILIKMIDDYVSKNAERAVTFTSLGQLRYLSAIQYMDAVIGNSSSGIVEVPVFKIPTINIGDRQKGRIMGASIINCEPEKTSIVSAIKMAVSENFKATLQNVENPYGEGGASMKIKEILKKAELSNILKKSFYDISF